MLTTLSALALTFVAGPATPPRDLFVTNRGDGSVLVFADGADGNVPPLRKIQGPATRLTPGSVNGIALDTVNDEVFVSLAGGTIVVFDLQADGNATPLRTLEGPATGLGFTAGLAVDPIHGELFAANPSANALLVFPRDASGNSAPLRVLQGAATGIAQPTAVFVDLDADEVFLTNEASSAPGLNVFPRTGNGNVAPLRSVLGPATTFNFAVGTFRNPATGEQIVGDLTSGRALTFPAGADGNVAPTRTLSSGSLGLPAGLTLTGTGELLIVDLTGGVVTFDPLSNGVSAPLRELRGPLTQLATPIYAASTESPFPGAVFTDAVAATNAVRTAVANPTSLSASAPAVLGSTFTLSVDLTSTGNQSALVIGSTAPTFVPLPTGPVVLIGGTRLLTLGPGAAPVATFNLNVPADLGLAGMTLFTQAIHLGGGPPLALSNAVDLTAGI